LDALNIFLVTILEDAVDQRRPLELSGRRRVLDQNHFGQEFLKLMAELHLVPSAAVLPTLVKECAIRTAARSTGQLEALDPQSVGLNVPDVPHMTSLTLVGLHLLTARLRDRVGRGQRVLTAISLFVAT
jgi:hypothetical protein